MKPIDLKPLPETFELRDVQDKAINMLRRSIANGKRRIVAHLPTGAGKTILAGKIFHQIFEKKSCAQVFFVVPRLSLLRQTQQEFENIFGYDCGIIQGQSEWELDKHVQVATIQTLNNRLNSKNPLTWMMFNDLKPDCVFIDEAHLIFKGFETVAKAYDEALMIGLTATPFTPGMGLFWDDVVRPESMVDLINNGVLSPYKVMACTPIDRTKLKKTSTGEYADMEVDQEVERITGDVYKEWKKSTDMEGRKFLLFAKSIKSCIALADHFSAQGVNIGYVHSKMSDDDIKDTIQAFKDGHFIGLASVVMLIEGFDYPDVSALIMCAPLAPSSADPNIPNSCNRYVQMAGRGLRAVPDKDYCLIHDHVGNFLNYGQFELIEELFPDLDTGKKIERKLSIEERKQRAVRECPMCGSILKSNICRECRHVTKKPTQFLQAGDLVFEDGEMVELKSSGSLLTAKYRTLKMTPAERKEFASELKGYILERRIFAPIKKEEGFYAHKYKDRTGKWPGTGYRFRDIKAKLPSGAFKAYIGALQRQYYTRKRRENSC